MLSKEQKKEAISKFREQKPSIGIYSIRCESTGRVWVGSSRNLNATHNGTWFSLRIGGHRDQELQREWTAHGEPAFTWRVLETIEDDVSPLLLPDVLKAKRLQWAAELKCSVLL